MSHRNAIPDCRQTASSEAGHMLTSAARIAVKDQSNRNRTNAQRYGRPKSSIGHPKATETTKPPLMRLSRLMLQTSLPRSQNERVGKTFGKRRNSYLLNRSRSIRMRIALYAACLCWACNLGRRPLPYYVTDRDHNLCMGNGRAHIPSLSDKTAAQES